MIIFVAACRNETNFSPDFQAVNVLTESQEDFDGFVINYWITKGGIKGKEAFFMLDLGCVKDIAFVRLINTHNAGHKDRSTKKFR